MTSKGVVMGSTASPTSAHGSAILRALLAAAASTLLLAGCAIGGTVTGPETTPPSSASPSSPSSPNADVPPKRWAAILGDLTARGVPTDSVALVSARTMTWNDGALGCPKPGQSYTQAQVPGMQVVVSVGSTTYDYRFGRSDNPKLCER